MATEQSAISETTLGYDVFAPLWGLVVLGATVDGGLMEFVRSRRADLDGILGAVREIGTFSDDTMAIFEEQGVWRHGRDLATDELAMDLVMYSGFVEEYPPDLDRPVVRRRLVRAGIDVQLVNLFHALVSAAMGRGPAAEPASTLIVRVIQAAGDLVGRDPVGAAHDTFRTWGVACLPSVLRPDSPTAPAARATLREYLRVLERHLIPPPPGDSETE